MILNQFLSYLFYKYKFLIITPKTHSFGGLYNSIFWGYKLKNKRKLNLILAIPLINLNEKNIFSIYGIDLIYLIFKKLSVIEKLFSVLISIFLNSQLIILFFFRKIRLWKLFRKQIILLISENIGFAHTKNKNDYFLNKINFNYDELVEENLNLSELYNKKKDEISCNVTFCIKDNNYSKIKEISSFMTSDINKCRKSLKFLTQNNCKVFRVGEKSMVPFDFSSDKYKNLYNLRSYKSLLNNSYANCSFYFGSSASHGIIPELFNKRKYIINHTEHLEISYSKSLDNYILFKKIFCNKLNKVLSVEEIFRRELYDYYTVKDSLKQNTIKLIENNEEEIFEGLIEFYEKNFKGIVKNNDRIRKYLEIRKELFKKEKHKDQKYCENFICNIPDFYLKKYLN